MSCRHQPRQRDWRWDASSWQSAVRSSMELVPCDPDSDNREVIHAFAIMDGRF
jgi:hypothetical protein